jgi:hypothetical protein
VVDVTMATFLVWSVLASQHPSSPLSSKSKQVPPLESYPASFPIHRKFYNRRPNPMLHPTQCKAVRAILLTQCKALRAILLPPTQFTTDHTIWYVCNAVRATLLSLIKLPTPSNGGGWQHCGGWQHWGCSYVCSLVCSYPISI